MSEETSVPKTDICPLCGGTFDNPIGDCVHIPFENKIEPTEIPIVGEVSLTCKYCTDENTLKQYLPGVTLKYCPICKVTYCSEHSSRIDPSKCKVCCSDIIVKETIVTRTDEHYNEEDDSIRSVTKSAKQITFEGMHWTFFTKAIASLTDEQLKVAFEYHRAMVYQIQNDIETRKVRKTQSLKLGTTVCITKRTETKKTRTVKQKVKTPESIAADLLKAGINPAKLLEILKALGTK